MSAKDKDFVRHLGEKIGYGNMMYLASELWKESLKRQGYPISGAFVPALQSKLSESEKQPDTESKLNIGVVMAMLPSDKEIEAEASSYDNSMSSVAESVWMPEGVRAGVKWVKDYMLKKVVGN